MKKSNIFPRHTNYDLPNAIRGEGCYIIDENDNCPNDFNVSQSDIRAVVRAELKSLRSQLRGARGGDSMSRIHIADALERVNNILDPK